MAKTSKNSNRHNFRSCEDIELKFSGLFQIIEWCKRANFQEIWRWWGADLPKKIVVLAWVVMSASTVNKFSNKEKMKTNEKQKDKKKHEKNKIAWTKLL